MRILITLGLLLGLSFALPVGVLAEELPTEYTLEMWNKDPDDKKRKMVFSEEIVTVAPGAAVTWLATDKGHNVQMIDGPEGYDLPKKSKLSKDVTLTFDQEGVYVYVCTPHASMGMIGIIVVGEATPEAIAAIKDAKMKGKSKKKFKTLVATLQQ